MFRLADHESRLRELAAQLEQRLMQRREVARIFVRGPAGAGRRTILRQLAKNPGIVAIDPPELADLDAALGALVQAASHVPESGKLVADHRSETGDIDQDMARRAEAVGKALADSGKAIALLVPPSWSESAEDPDTHACARRARAFVAGIEAAAKLPIVMLGLPPPGSRTHGYSMIELAPLRLEAADLDPGALGGTLRAAAERLTQHLRATRAEAAPALLRLRLGLIALGAEPASLDGLHLIGLARQLVRRLSPAQAAGLGRLLLARRALEPAVIEQLTGLGGDDLALVTTCVAYGREQLQVGEPARAALLEQLHEAGHRPRLAELEAAHKLLADHYRSLPGADAARLDGLPPAAAIAWMEKVHHLAHGGARAADEWRAQHRFSRELLWARGRWLGRTGHYKLGGNLFRDSLGFGDHPYAHHYYAANMDRDRDDREMIEHHYRDAVTFDPENPWWSARLVTFLIAYGSFDKARYEWRELTDRVDPAGSQMRESSRLALRVHRWVAGQWLAQGHVAEARAVLDEVPPRFVRLAQPLARLAQELADAEAAAPRGDGGAAAATTLPAAAVTDADDEAPVHLRSWTS
ncbi:MAG TPA: hypothetical protein VNO30_01365 [Kofleriaceae bacterium]|nr:hypothetical protein [Kofleriaceae bacterium]